MDSWSEEQYRRMIASGGSGKWREYWELHAGNDAAKDDKDKGGLAQQLRLKYESDVARAYREALTLKVASNSTSDDGPNPNTSTIQGAAAPVVPLPEDVPPTLQETIDYLSTFFLSMITSSQMAVKYLCAWGMIGFSSAYTVYARGRKAILNNNESGSVTSSLPNINPTVHGYMGATTTPQGYNIDMIKTNFLTLGILALFAGIPYVLFRIFTTKMAKTVLNNRQDAFKSAKNLLMERIACGRVQRMERCDVYYPSASEGCTERRAKCGLVFYPGALVDRAAYAPIATKLSEAGILVVIANLEPNRFIDTFNNYNLKEEVMRTIAHSILLCENGAWTVDKWALGGHSLGGHIALAAVANELSSTITKIVMWGVRSYPQGPNYPCKSLKDNKNVQVLVVNGSNDAIINSTKFSGTDKFVDFEEKMPPRCHLPLTEAFKKKDAYTFMVTVEGGNHAGCAHYGPQKFPSEDGIRTITLEVQQDKFAKATADFLLGTDKRE